MFALLEHTTADRVHWDFVVEVPGQDLLPTWRLARNPLDHAGLIEAERISDHKPHFLAYEGKLSGSLGTVRRLDGGPAKVRQLDAARLEAQLSGGRLRGRVRISAMPDGRAWFRLAKWMRKRNSETRAGPTANPP